MASDAVKDRIESEAGTAILERIALLAKAVGESAKESPEDAYLTVNGHTVHALPGGMCARLARELQERGMGIPDGSWEFHRGTAKEVEEALIAADRRISGCLPGTVGCYDDGSVGHIVTYIGNNMVAENTSSHRGSPSRPGTKISSLSEVAKAHGGSTGRWYLGITI